MGGKESTGEKMDELLKGNYKVKQDRALRQGAVEKNEPSASESKTREYEKKAKNSVGGSMVFVERRKVIWKP